MKSRRIGKSSRSDLNAMKDAQEVEDRTDPLANGQRDVITVHPMDQVVNKRRLAGSTKPEERNHGSHSNLFIGQLTD